MQAFLGQAIDPPSIASMDRALITLEELGSIDNAGTLTALGKHMVSLVGYAVCLYLFAHAYLFILQSMLPLDIRLAKVIIFFCPFPFDYSCQ